MLTIVGRLVCRNEFYDHISHWDIFRDPALYRLFEQQDELKRAVRIFFSRA
ncbi:MAG: hypothetical protein DDT35_00599 [Firmicutes bacterium]|nr:hypothetical protein [Bacillota bacterium]